MVADLISATRIEAAAEKSGFQVKWIENEEQFIDDAREAGGFQELLENRDIAPRRLGEQLVGTGAVLLQRLVDWQPALILVDLGNGGIPWKEWIALIKTSPATRRIPLLCFGSHMNVSAIQAAKSAGAESVLARSRFFEDMATLISHHARLPDYEGFEQACQTPLSKLALKGLELFNHGEYFEAHEYLEEAWNEDQSSGRELYRAILQVAVAYLQIERGNYNGAMKMFMRLRQWIDPLPDKCRGVDVAKLKDDAEEAKKHLADLGKERISEFDRRLLKPVVYDAP
jgi:CheY-like chemotaxis protein